MKINRRTVSLILSIMGVLGVGTTSYLSVRCSKKADTKETKKEKIIAYAPAIISGVVTSGCIIGSHHVSSKEIAALTASCGYLAANRDKIEKAVKEKFGDEKAKEIHQEAAVKAMTTHKNDYIEVTGYGDTLFGEYYFGRKFFCSLERVEWAEKQMNYRFHNGEYVSMNDFYEMLNLEQTRAGSEFGWPANEDFYDYNMETPIEFEHVYGEDENGNPMIMIDIRTSPMEGFYEL